MAHGTLDLPEREDSGLKGPSDTAIFPIGKNGLDPHSASAQSSRSGRARMIITAEDFGRQVAEARRALGLTQRDLALAIGTGERFIVELEAGKATAQLGKALAAARAVGIGLENTARRR